MAGCATAPPMVYVRTDGRQIDKRSFAQQLAIDKTMCEGEAERARLSAGTNYLGGVIAHSIEENRKSQSAVKVEEGCMAGRGYVRVLETQAPEAAALYAQTAAERKAIQPQR
jgi:hypothetical protein